MANTFKSISKNRIVQEQGPLLALILLILAFFLCQVLFGPGWFQNLMTVPARISHGWENLLEGNVTAATLLTLGTLLTSAFLHGNVEHVLFNMVFLWIFAALVAELLGHRWMLLIFTVSAVSGSILHSVLNAGDPTPMLGASGAVMGFMGAYLGLAIRWQLPDPHIWPMSRPVPPTNLALLAVIGVVLDVMGIVGREQTNIAYGAHVGGFLAGLFLTSFAGRRLRSQR